MNQDSNSDKSLKFRLREVSRSAILRAAEELLAEKGLHSTRMEDVAARAGVSVGTIYNHVGDRQAVVDALLEAQRKELLARIDEVLARAGHASFEDLLEPFVRAVLAHFDAHLPLFRLLIEDELAHGRRETKRSAMRMLSERVSRLVDIGLDEGVLSTEDAEIYPDVLTGMLRGLLVQSLLHGRQEPLAARAAAAARFFLRGAGKCAP